MSLLESIQEIDIQGLILINRTIANDFFDNMLPIWREKKVWIPLYILILIITVSKWKRKAIPWILILVIAVTVGDVVSSHIIKPYFGRLRPCADASVFPLINFRAPYCGGNGSFTSSHATNHGIIAFYIAMTMGRYLGNWKWLMVLWAFTIGIAQIYVGVHYPTDILGGFVLGFLIAYLFANIWKMKFAGKSA